MASELHQPRVAPTFKLGGNFFGAGGRRTSLRQCFFRDDDLSVFGWNWTREQTDPRCAAGKCSSPECFADFSYAGVSYGTGPFGGNGTGAKQLPVNTSRLKSLLISQNVSWQWVDTAPGVSPPQTSPKDMRRTRLIYDFFLTSVRPNGTNIASAITDEVTIQLAGNPHFPGSQPPGCNDPHSRYENNTGPVVKNAVWDGHHWYDYWYTDHHDAVPGTGSRYSSFRRVGAGDPGAQPPAEVELMPFFEAIRQQWPGEQVGPWLGELSISTELYDHCTGNVTFWAPPAFQLAMGQGGEALAEDEAA